MYSARLDQLPPYPFARIDELKEEKEKQGVDLIDLGIGDPDLPTPPHIIDALCAAARDPANHHYPSYVGMSRFRTSVASWYRDRFQVSLDPENEVISLMGSKDGIAHIPEAFVDPGDYVLVPDPGYPVYRTSTLFAEGRIHIMPLRATHDFLPCLDDIPSPILRSAKLMFLNYPNNPTAAIAPREFFQEVVDFATDHEIVVVHDNAYSEVTFDGYHAPSFLESHGAKEVGVEMHSLSKTYNMTGWRIGMACGNAEILAGLKKVKTNVDSGVFNAVQIAASVALTGPQECVRKSSEIYEKRRNTLVQGLTEMGIECMIPKATFYLWVPVKNGLDFATRLLDEAGVVVTPGIGFGSCGRAYVRFAITRSLERIEQAIDRIRRVI
ncbi:MAG: LL-diaminopimelate aminotransferase [Methanomicrobiales archaeon]|nr:LL-diaminopimelate aminotransferase [Methanomicrobiales archaeon]